MIVSAKYIGPFPEVTFNGVTAKPGETARLRVPEGQVLAGCWEVVDDVKAPVDGIAEGAPGASAGSQKKKGD